MFNHYFKIQATEESHQVSPLPSATTEVTVIVTDVNDEIPRFRSERYIGEVLENAQQNTPITFLHDSVPEVFDYDQVISTFSHIIYIFCAVMRKFFILFNLLYL